MTLRVFDIAGREVSTLVDEYMSGGLHMASFNGSHLASGIFFYRLCVDGNLIDAKKALLVR